MIRSFKDRRLKRLFERGDRSKVPPDMADKIENVLGVLDVAVSVEDVDLPGYRLHPLKGDLAGLWSVTIRANWRIVFRFENGTAFDLELIDYH
jgi:proteic killer suppression protein